MNLVQGQREGGGTSSEERSSPVVSGDLTLPDLDLQPKPKQQALTNRRISLSSCRPAPLSGSINSLLIISPRTNTFPSSPPLDSLSESLCFFHFHISPLQDSLSLCNPPATLSCRVIHTVLPTSLPPLAPRFRGPAPLAAVIIMRDDDVSHIEMRSRLDSSRSAEPFFNLSLSHVFDPPSAQRRVRRRSTSHFSTRWHAVRRSIRLGKSIFIT